MATTVDRPAAGQAEAVAEHRLFIDGEWRTAPGGKTFEVRNPATGEVLARCADGGRAETRVRRSRRRTRAFPAWARHAGRPARPAARARRPP